MASSSFLSGMLHQSSGWETLNYIAIVPVLAIAVGLLFLMFRGRPGALAPSA